MALKGTLRDFNVADIFQLIAQQQKSGILVISTRTTVVRVFFSRGALVRAELTERDKERDILGQMLLRGEVCTEAQLATAMDIKAKTLKRLEDILIEQEIVDKETLRDFIKLRNMETISRLFDWKDGNYEFEQTDVSYDQSLDQPVGAESILMEAFRIIDEWPSVRAVVTHYSMTFNVNGTLKQLEASAKQQKFEGGEKRVFKILLEEPRRDVQKIIDLSRLGEFEACKALFALSKAGLIEPIPPKHGLAIGAMSGGSLKDSHRIKPAKVALVALLALTFAASVALFGRTAVGTAIEVLKGRSEDTIKSWALGESLSTAQKKKISRALETWRLTQGAYPAALDVLVRENVLSEKDTRYPWQLPYAYRPTGEGYILLDPPY